MAQRTVGPTPGLSVVELLTAYRQGRTTPARELAGVADAVAAAAGDAVWITTSSRDELLRRAAELEADPAARRLPLYGVPFAVKDSLDVAGLPTTCGCPDYAYVPERTAPVVDRLVRAGAVLVGKTNLDQFATGLNGTRSPYGVPRSVYGGDLVSGGSSSGSALAVATGQVPFAVATDTAGSGRVPAALNGILGFKPSRGLLSTVGLVPACRSLDCVSLMGTSVADLRLVFDVVAGTDDDDPWTRPRSTARTPLPRIGLPPADQLVFPGDDPMRRAHERARAAVASAGPVVEVPLAPFLDAGALLYQGPWVAERLAEFGDFLDTHPGSVLPVVAGIIASGREHSAVDAFRAQYRLQELRAEVQRLWRDVDVVLLPTVGTTSTVAEVLADPVATNTALGLYTHCGNLLDLCAVAVPAGTTEDGRPASVMVLGPALADETVLDVAAALSLLLRPDDGDGATRTQLAVAGHHLAGQPRNVELTDRGARLVERTRTAADHRLLRVGDAHPVPALLRAAGPGTAIEVEVWELPAAELPGLLAGMPPVLALGRVELADGRTVPGMVCAPDVATGASGLPVTDISASGGWRQHLAAPPLHSTAS